MGSSNVDLYRIVRDGQQDGILIIWHIYSLSILVFLQQKIGDISNYFWCTSFMESNNSSLLIPSDRKRKDYVDGIGEHMSTLPK